jgi:ParB family chromosome partitioning protein
MNAQANLIRVQLQQLQLSPLNARKTGGTDIDGLAASIAAHGLLQNLTVTHRDGTPVFEVVAGGRRLAAMQQLQREGRLAATFDVPVYVINDDSAALEASTAENTLREAMHPADQFTAFKGMVDAGKSIPDIAAHFGVTERIVTQRLKLANIAPDLVEVYRGGDMQLDQLQALALTDDHDVQRQAWNVKQVHERGAYNIRERITKRDANADCAIARFVGLPVYEAAGGTLRRDLFSDRAWVQDKALLDRVALDKLEQLAQAERDAGWSWAEARLSADYSDVAQFGRLDVEPTFNKPTPAMEQRLGEVLARRRQIAKLAFDEDGNQREDIEQDLADRLIEEDDEFGHEERELEQGAEAWPAESMATGGVLLYIDDYNGLRIVRGLLQPGQKQDKATGTVTGKSKPATTDQKPKKPEFNGAVLTTLSAHRSEVARYHVARDPQLAVALLVDWFVSAMKHDFSSANVLSLSITSVPDASKVAPDLHKALSDDSGLPLACFKKIPRTNRLAWLISQPPAELQQMLAYCVAQRFGGITENEKGHAGIAALHAAIGFDMADHWNAGCDNFLRRIPAPLVLEAVTEVKGKAAAAAMTGLRRPAIVAEAAKLLAGTGWLPKPLRGNAWKLPIAEAATPKPTAKKAAKKAAKKTAAKKPVAKKSKIAKKGGGS